MTSSHDSGRSDDDLAQLVEAAAAERARHAEAQARQTVMEAQRAVRRRWSATAFLLLLVPALIVLTALNLSGDASLLFGRPAPSAAEYHRRSLADISFAVEAIDAYRARRGHLPASLGAVDIRRLERWRYEIVSGDHYRVAVTEGGQTVTFDSREDREEFFAPLRGGRQAGER